MANEMRLVMRDYNRTAIGVAAILATLALVLACILFLVLAPDQDAPLALSSVHVRAHIAARGSTASACPPGDIGVPSEGCVPRPLWPNASACDMVDERRDACREPYLYANGRWLTEAPLGAVRVFDYAERRNARLETQKLRELEWDADVSGALFSRCVDARATTSLSARVRQMLQRTHTLPLDELWAELTASGLPTPLYVRRERSLIDGADVTYVQGRLLSWQRMRQLAQLYAWAKLDYDEEYGATERARTALLEIGAEREPNDETFAHYVAHTLRDADETSERDPDSDAFKWSRFWRTLASLLSLDAAYSFERRWRVSAEYAREFARIQAETESDMRAYARAVILVGVGDLMPLDPIDSIKHGVAPWHRVHASAEADTAEGDETCGQSLDMHLVEDADVFEVSEYDTRCEALTAAYLRERAEAYYSDRRPVEEAERLVHQIVEAARARMEASRGWLGDTATDAAIRKYTAVEVRVGTAHHPLLEALSALSSESLSECGELVDCVLLLRRARVRRALDGSDAPFEMEPSRVNAYYSPLDNSISVLAGIVEYPFFASKLSAASRLAGLGFVVGHELGHAIDAFGAQFDERGAMREWPGLRTRRYTQWVECLVAQYSRRTRQGTQQDGGATLGENQADQFGLALAEDVLEATVGGPGDAPDAWREFYAVLAQIWAMRLTREAEQLAVASDVHSIAETRINNALQNSERYLVTRGCYDGLERSRPVCPLPYGY